MSGDDKKEAEIALEEMICDIFYLKNSNKARFVDLKKRIKNDYVLNKVECPRTVTGVQSLILNYQPNYNYNMKSQYQGVGNKMMFTQRGKMGMTKVNKNSKIKHLKEKLTTPPAIIGGEKSTMWETVNTPHKKISKRTQKHSRRRNK